MNKVSLVLTTYNSLDNMKQTLDSIVKQDYQRIQVAIKDGGSTDGTLEYIKEFVAKCPSDYPNIEVVWKSAPDSGIYDAMNQGYEMTDGDIVAFFNDILIKPDAISKIVRAIETGDGANSIPGVVDGSVGAVGESVIGAHADLVYAIDVEDSVGSTSVGGTSAEVDDASEISEEKANGMKNTIQMNYKVVRKWHMGPQKPITTGWMPGHPTLYLKREVFEKYGVFSTDFKIAADYEFMVRILKDSTNRLAYVPENLVRMLYGGTSNATIGSYITSLKEGHQALVMNGIKMAFWTDIRRMLRVLLQFVNK